MAGAETACASGQADTILGITRSLASPAYRRLERYEPWLKFAVPAFLAVFLLALAASAWTQVRNSRDEALVDAINDIDVLASLAAARFGTRILAADPAVAAARLRELANALPAAALTRGRIVLVVHASDTVQAVYPPSRDVPGTLGELLG
jgi:two-component system cell cycle sensor histidine kinase PleC